MTRILGVLVCTWQCSTACRSPTCRHARYKHPTVLVSLSLMRQVLTLGQFHLVWQVVLGISGDLAERRGTPSDVALN